MQKIQLLDKDLYLLVNFFSKNVFVPMNVFILNSAGSIVWASDRLLKEANVEQLESILGKSVAIFGNTVYEGVIKVMYSKKEEMVVEKYNTSHYITCRYPVVDSDGMIKYIAGVSFNIDQIKQAEFAKQEFLQNMAHDLRTPLAGIIGLSSLQAAGDIRDPEEVKEYGRMIHGAGEQLLELFNTVIQIIDTEHMTDSVKAAPLDLADLAKELQTLMEPSVYNKGLQFKLKLSAELPIVLSDHVQLKRVLLNLLSNAVKFTKQGEVGLTVTLLSVENDQAKIEMQVVDTGIGIAENHLDKIFDRFYRVHPSYRAEYDGYGVGLYLVKAALQLLKGNIEVFSEEGKGTCFTLQCNFPVFHQNRYKM